MRKERIPNFHERIKIRKATRLIRKQVLKSLNRIRRTNPSADVSEIDLSKLETTPLTEDILQASILKASFWEFVKYFWDVIVSEKMIPNWHMRYICDEMQKCAERVFKGEERLHDEIFNVPPGSSKSTICSVMFPIWVWTRMPSARSICCSFSDKLANRLSRISRRLIKSPEFANVFPDIKLREDQDAIEEFGIYGGGVRFAIGSGSQVMGSHAHFIIIDDPINPKNVLSELELDRINNWIKEELSGRKVDKMMTVTFLIMQRLHQNDPSAMMGAKKRVKWVRIPAVDSYVVSPPGLKKYYIKGVGPDKTLGYLDPKRMPQRALDEVQEGPRGDYVFAGQFGQDPVPPGGGMFKVKRIIRWPVTKRLPKFKQIVRFWDKAGTLGGGAYTVGIKMGITAENRIFILDVIRDQLDSFAREKLIRQTARMDGRHVIIGLEQEGGSGGKESVEGTVRRLVGFNVKVIVPKGKKEDRADPFSTQVNAGNVHMLTDANGKDLHWNAAYIDELKFFPVSTFKDQVDASSGCFSVLLKGLRRIGGMRKGMKSVYKSRKRMLRRIGSDSYRVETHSPNLPKIRESRKSMRSSPRSLDHIGLDATQAAKEIYG